MAGRDPLLRLREICLSFPDAYEKIAWGEPTFRATGGMFAMYTNNHHGDGIVGVWVKAPPMVQEILTKSDPKRFYVPPYMGPSGWVGVRLDYKVNWEELAAILEDGYKMSVKPLKPKRPKRSIASAPKRARAEAAPIHSR